MGLPPIPRSGHSPQREDELDGCAWFLRDVDRMSCELRLEHYDEGTYAVRRNEDKRYIISIKTESGFEHVEISKTYSLGSWKYALNPDTHWFDSLNDLIAFYRHHPLDTRGPASPTVDPETEAEAEQVEPLLGCPLCDFEELEEMAAKLKSVGLDEDFCATFKWSRDPRSLFRDSETDAGWIDLIMTDKCEVLGGVEYLESLETAEALRKLGFIHDAANEYAEFLDASAFKDSRDIFEWAFLKVIDSGILDIFGNEDFMVDSHHSTDEPPPVIKLNTDDVHSVPRIPNGQDTANEFELMVRRMRSQLPEGSSLWFHATTTRSAQNILRRGVRTNRRGYYCGRRKDFSHCEDFYLCSNEVYALSSCQQIHLSPVSILVFRIDEDIVDFLGGAESGLDLRFEYSVEADDDGVSKEVVPERDAERLSAWRRVIQAYSGDKPWREASEFDAMDFIIGPASDHADGPRLRQRPLSSDQICIKRSKVAKKLNECLVKQVNFV